MVAKSSAAFSLCLRRRLSGRSPADREEAGREPPSRIRVTVSKKRTIASLLVHLVLPI
jgi:hypothetical protein